MSVLLAETWRRKGAEIVTEVMVVWSIAAWLSMIVQEVPWAPPETHRADDLGLAGACSAKPHAAAGGFHGIESRAGRGRSETLLKTGFRGSITPPA